jgi:hypothetical protein
MATDLRASVSLILADWRRRNLLNRVYDRGYEHVRRGKNWALSARILNGCRRADKSETTFEDGNEKPRCGSLDIEDLGVVSA